MATSEMGINGYYQDFGIIQMDNGNNIDLLLLDDNWELPKVPYGTKINLSIKYEEVDFLNGTNGIVWATYNYAQADTIKNALFIQNIFGEIRESKLVNTILYKVRVANVKEIRRAIDFIWRDDNGLRLKPDWHYRKDEVNTSFNKWLNGE